MLHSGRERAWLSLRYACNRCFTARANSLVRFDALARASGLGLRDAESGQARRGTVFDDSSAVALDPDLVGARLQSIVRYSPKNAAATRAVVEQTLE